MRENDRTETLSTSGDRDDIPVDVVDDDAFDEAVDAVLEGNADVLRRLTT